MERLIRKYQTKRVELSQALSLKFRGTMRDQYTGDIYTAEEVSDARKFGAYFDAVMTAGPIPIDRPEPFRPSCTYNSR